MSSFYLKQCLRLWFIHHGSMDGVEKSVIGKRLEQEFKTSRIKSMSDFIYKTLGYRDDSFLNSTSRFDLRKEVMENINNEEYWDRKRTEMSVKRTSEVIEELERLDAVGLGMERVSDKTSEVSFKGYNRFIKSNKELVNTFCRGYKLFNTNLVDSNGSPLSIYTLKTMLKCSSYKEFKSLKNTYKIKPVECFNLIYDGTTVMTDEGIHLPKSEHQDDFICECLLFTICLGATCETVEYYKYCNTLVPELLDIFNISDKTFQYLVDLSFLTGKTLKELANLYGFNVEELEYMIEKTQGLYTTIVMAEQSVNVRYLPSTVTDSLAIAATFPMDRFLLLVNSGMNLDIIYQDGFPYLEGVKLSGGEF